MLTKKLRMFAFFFLIAISIILSLNIAKMLLHSNIGFLIKESKDKLGAEIFSLLLVFFLLKKLRNPF